MNRKKTDSSASDVSASGHSNSNSNNNKSKAIATGAAKVFNKMILKSRPSTAKSPAEENFPRFQMVHTPDRSPVEMPLSGFPTTNEEFDAAISRINAQGRLYGENGSVEQKGATAGARKATHQGSYSPSTVPRKSITTPGSTTVFLGPRDNGSLDKLRKGLDTPEPTPSATASGKSRPTYARRVASDGVPPRPLSERPMIYSSTRPSLQKPHGSVSTPNVRSVLPLLRNSAPGQRYSPIRTNSVEKIGRRRPRRPPSVDSLTDGSVENTDSEDKASRNGGSSARNTRDPQNTMKDSHTMGPDAARVPEKSMCYFCKEYCQAGDNLCSKCQTRFQPQEEVFDYSESEYEDDLEWEDQSCFSPDTEQPPATPSRLSKRRNTRYSRLREKSRGWSELSSMSQLQQLASRSASTSPTSHIALELKVVPPQDIKIRTVSSPTRANAGDRRSALHHIQQAMKPRGSINHGCQDRDAIRLGRVRSGEIRRVDYPDIVKAKPPTPKESEFPRDSQEHQQQSQGSTGNWLKCYDEDDKNSERHSDSARSDCLELLPDREHSAVPAPPGTYDRVTSIYDLYASFEDT